LKNEKITSYGKEARGRFEVEQNSRNHEARGVAAMGEIVAGNTGR